MPYFRVHLDYETAQSVGNPKRFQVISIEDENDKSMTHLIDSDANYSDLDELARGIAEALGIKPSEVELEDVSA